MKKQAILRAATCAVAALAAGCGGNDNPSPFYSAAFGDVPYGTDLVQFKAVPSFVATISADKDLSQALHVGDLHSGSEPCTQVFDQAVATFFTKFTLPLVYTPGDNEWADCQKSKQLNGKYTATVPELNYPVNATIPSYAGGDPVANLQLVRSLFFSQAGKTLGSGSLTVHSQAQEGKTASDKQFVENVWWPAASNRTTRTRRASATPSRISTAWWCTAAPCRWNGSSSRWTPAPTPTPAATPSGRSAGSARWFGKHSPDRM